MESRSMVIKKARKVGRPKVSKEHAHSRIALVRLKSDDFKLFLKAAKANKQTLSQWMRTTLKAAVQISR